MSLDRPKFKKVFDSAIFRDIGSVDEVLEVNWTKPNGQPGTKAFPVGSHVFLENPSNLSDVPDYQLVASLSMAAILGFSVPGTKEYKTNMGADQDIENFQSIVGPFKLDTVTPVDDAMIGGPGEVYELKVKKLSGQNSKTFKSEVYSLSDYDTIKGNYDHVADRLPGALHAQFGFKKSDLGVSGSANRTSVINYILNQKFWA